MNYHANFNDRIIARYLDETKQYPLLSKEEEVGLAKRVQGHAALEMLVSAENFLFARDYAAQAASHSTRSSRFSRECHTYLTLYPVTKDWSVEKEVNVLRLIYQKDATHYDNFIATCARYLMGLKEYEGKVSPPVSRTAWKKQEDALARIRKEKQIPIIYAFSSEMERFAIEHPEIKQALYKAYQRLYIDAQDAHKLFVSSNLRLVVSIARGYSNRGLPFEDLIQHGNLGLMHSIEKFEYARGFKFSTYATWWIRQSIIRGIESEGYTIRIPVHALETIHKLERIQKEYSRIFEREATTAEFRAYAAKEMGITQERVDLLLAWKRRLTTVSLDAPIGPETETTLRELYDVPDHEEVTLIHNRPEGCDIAYDEMQLRSEVYAAIANHLTPREEKVIRLRYGIGEPESLSLEEIGAKFSLTRERIRQIEARALKKLRKQNIDIEL